MNTTQVRHATPEDFPRIMEMGHAMHKESPRFQKFSFDDEKCRKLFDELVNQGGVFLAVLGEEIVGMFVGMIHEHYFSSELTASDLALYVVPEHRGGSAAVRLIKAFEGWAFAHEARCMTLSSNTKVDTEKAMALFGKMGYEYCGGVTYKENPDVS